MCVWKVRPNTFWSSVLSLSLTFCPFSPNTVSSAKIWVLLGQAGGIGLSGVDGSDWAKLTPKNWVGGARVEPGWSTWWCGRWGERERVSDGEEGRRGGKASSEQGWWLSSRTHTIQYNIVYIVRSIPIHIYNVYIHTYTYIYMHTIQVQ